MISRDNRLGNQQCFHKIIQYRYLLEIWSNWIFRQCLLVDIFIRNTILKVRIICHLSSSPLWTALNLLPIISFSVDELDDELDEDEDEESSLFLFSCVDLDFFHLFLLEHFTIFGLDEGEFIFIFLDLGCLSCFLVEEISRFSDTLLLVHHMSYLQLFHFFALPHHWS